MQDKEPFWLEVENLGPIDRARVEVGGLTVFIGDNSAGKSYLANAIWAVCGGGDWLRDTFQGHDDFAPIVDWAHAFVEGDLTRERRRMSSSVGVDWVEKHAGNNALSDIASALPLTLNDLRARVPARTIDPLEVEFERIPRGIEVRLFNGSGRDSCVQSLSAFPADGVRPKDIERLVRHALMVYAEPWRFDIEPHRGALLLPAARPGAVQLLPRLIDEGLKGLASKQERGRAERLLPSVVAFLQFLARIHDDADPSDPRLRAARELLESQALRGRIEAKGQGRFAYRSGGGVHLPVALASSIVGELLPLDLVLRQQDLPALLVYEEPEAHLHPKLQRVVARVLVRLVNLGVKVVVTTHGDNFVQQINNLIKLQGVADPSRIKGLSPTPSATPYGPEDKLHPSDVKAYEFRVMDTGRSQVLALAVDQTGISVDTFVRPITALADEARALDAALDDEPPSAEAAHAG